MSGFFEWNQKQPYYFRQAHDHLLAVAGIWDVCLSQEGEVRQTCCLITTKANELISPVHRRMPVLLTEEGISIWLDNSHYSQEELIALLTPYSGTDLMGYPVTPRMNFA